VRLFKELEVERTIEGCMSFRSEPDWLELRILRRPITKRRISSRRIEAATLVIEHCNYISTRDEAC